MKLGLSWPQRGLLIFAGLFLILWAMNSNEGYGAWDSWLATLQFLLAVVCFVLAAQPRGKTDG